MRLLLGSRRGRLLQATLLASLTVLAGVGLMGTSGWLIARAAEHPNASALTLAAVCVRALGVGRGVSRYAERIVGHDAVLRWVAELRVAVFGQLSRQQGRLRTSEALGALGRDVEGLQDLWLRGVLPWGSAAAVAVVVVPVASLVNAPAGLVLGAGLLVALGLLPGLTWKLQDVQTQLVAARAAHLESVTDLLHGCADLVTAKGTTGALAASDRAARDLARLTRTAALRGAVLVAIAVLTQGVTTVAVTWVGWHAVLSGDLSRVWFVALTLGGFAAFEPAIGVIDAVAAVRSGWAALERVSSLQEPTPLPAGQAEGSVALVVARGLGLAHPGRYRPALQDVDLQIFPGDRLAVVGGSGAGKSTLLALLAGQLAPTSGSLRVAGIAPHTLTQQQRPETVVLVEQEAHVFDASLRDNLRLGRPSATDVELERVLRVVGLGAWLDGLDDGLATQLGHRGSRLSGGQRRRLTVGRGLLSPAPLLLLDEPTEGLSPREADALVDAVLTEAADRAVVLVTHRVTALDGLDRVLVLERGVVVQSGSPGEVRAGPGLVREAWEAQRLTLVPSTDDLRICSTTQQARTLQVQTLR